jgi:hypothetical protein
MHAKVGVANAQDSGSFMMKSSSASVLSQLSKLVLGSTCFILAISAANVGVNRAKQALFADALTVSPKLISWTSNLHPAFKSSATIPSLSSPLDTVATDSFSDDVSTQIHQGLKRIALLEKSQHQALRRARIVHISHPHILLASAPQVTRDEVKISQSAVEPAKPAVYVPATEAEKLQSVQALLVSHFFIAMNDAPKMTTQLAQSSESVNTQAKIGTVLKLIGPQKHPVAPKPVAVKKQEQMEVVSNNDEAAVDDKADSSDAVSVQTQRTESLPLKSSPQQITTASTSQEITRPDTQVHLTIQSAGQPPSQQWVTNPAYPPSVPLILKNMAITPPSTAPPVAPANSQPAARLVTSSEQNVISSHTPSVVASMAQQASQMWASNEYSPKPISNQSGYSKPLVLSTQSPTDSNTPKTSTTTNPSGIPVKAATVIDKIGSSSSAPYNVGALSATPQKSSFGPLLDRTGRWAFHEAFDWGTSVVGPQVEVLSQEGAVIDKAQTVGQSAGQTLGWRIAKASQHWATLFWSTPNQEEVPMLNALSAKMLSVKASAALQNDAGIVLAKVPAGWSLEFSGRSERPLIFDRTNHILSPSATEGLNGSERYYVFLNASPGEQILYLNHTGGETGALAIPVLGGVMAYADLTQVEKRTISGRILEAAENSPHGVPGIHVQVVGSGLSTVTGSSGDFHIDNVIAFGDQNLYLETETQKSFPHRYKLTPSATTHLSLFHLNEAQVHEWIGQLEGGVSSESGLILGALPTLAASQEDRKPSVGTRSLANGPTLTPETYTLSGSGQLMVKTPLNGMRSRFISVQVPEGPTLVEVVDKDNRLIWSEITVVSPRVLTIVGPY